MNERKQRKQDAATTLMQLEALHHAWTVLDGTDGEGVEINGIHYANREQIDETARALACNVWIRCSQWRTLEQWEDPHEPLLVADTCRIRLVANGATIEIETPMAGTRGVPEIRVIKPDGKTTPMKVKPQWIEAAVWLAERFGAD